MKHGIPTPDDLSLALMKMRDAAPDDSIDYVEIRECLRNLYSALRSAGFTREDATLSTDNQQMR